MTAPTISDTATALEALTIGQRAWFWLCQDAEPRLLATSVGEDRDMSQIQAAAEAIRPSRAPWISGVMSLDGEGRLNLYSQDEQADGRALQGLAEWAAEHHAEHPGLAALRGARLLRVDASGRIRAEAPQPVAWEELPERVVPGSVADAARKLLVMGEGEQRILWMCGSPAHIIVARTPVDLRPAVDAFCRRHEDASPPVQGLLRREGGTLGLFSQAAPAEIAAVLPAILSLDPELALLARAWQIQLRDDGRIGQIQTPPPDELADRLAALKPGDRALFWFHPKVGLDLDADKDALQQRTAEHAGGARGQLRVHSEGWIELQLGRPAPGFLAVLIGWVNANLARRPELARLRRARVSVRDRVGETIERQRDDRAWSAC